MIQSSVYDVIAKAALSHPREMEWIATKGLLAILKSHRTLILTISCVIAVLVDPLFFYLPIIDGKRKCIGMDTILRNVTLIFRSLTDIGFIVNIIHKICEAVNKTRADCLKNIEKMTAEERNRGESGNKFAKSLARNLSWHTILIDFLAVLPIPQVIIVAVRSSRCLDKRKMLNFLLLAQYLPRVYRMRYSSIQLRPRTGIWVKCSFYFFLYILASHVLGAFWYYFSIQQETSCWHRACKKHGGVKCNFYCHENMTSRDLTFINSIDKYCLVDVPANETAPFDFGIFLDSLKNNNTASIQFPKKFFYSYWWGLRNLSNFGTNLQTSTYVWENCFAILISIIGLLLFLYLIGKVQTFISMKTTNSEERRKKFKSKELDIQMWMRSNDLKTDMMEAIRVHTNKKWEEIQDANIENLFSILPVQSRKHLKQSLCMEMLSKVPKLRTLKDEALKPICYCLKPVVYQDNSFVFQEGEPLDRILFITEGLIWTYQAAGATDSSSTSQNGKGKTGFSFLQKGEFYGDDQLLSWVIASQQNLPLFTNLPISEVNVKCHAKVEGFVLMAKDLKIVVSTNYKVYWGLHNSSQEREKALIQAVKNVRDRRKMQK
ncbi:putative potassium channel, voltage-dependent, ERG [Rosa chinensis]|uniref:Putative potassium channel, voltage-dependent, ERG n=1 Tax=Rosa chinensis TaxID=74649 RepID=A0A2P6QEP9_ROSCH|nr:putative potassium channel, voltage-dependent, ERG [Rosa chinensis]